MSMRMDMEETPEENLRVNAPQRIWLHKEEEDGPWVNAVWCGDSVDEDDVEYVRVDPEREDAAMAFVREYIQNGCHHACTRATCSVSGQKRMARAEAILGKMKSGKS